LSLPVIAKYAKATVITIASKSSCSGIGGYSELKIPRCRADR
jgi:hypothetical protein